MEIRCEKCNKLFRVSDDKITGAGIKFPCTRCGDYVRITREDFQHYILSQSTDSVLDVFEPKPGPAAAPLSLETEGPIVTEAATAATESMAFEPAATSAPEDVREEEAPPFVEPVHAQPVSATEPEPAVEPKPAPLMLLKPKSEPPVEPQPGPQEETKPLMEAATKAAPAPTPPAPPSKPKTETPRPAAPTALPAAERADQGLKPSATPSHSGRMVPVLLGTLIVLGLAGYGVFVYLQPSSQNKVDEAAREMISIEGLQIVNPLGSLDANGDLLITGVIENAAEKERTAWYVVAEVYDAQGAVLSKIRLLNGNQIYSRRDYDILAKRGANVQELKAKVLQQKGIVIPPKGRVSFEARYVQPPAGIASFVAQPVPFDRVQVNKEIAEEIK